MAFDAKRGGAGSHAYGTVNNMRNADTGGGHNGRTQASEQPTSHQDGTAHRLLSLFFMFHIAERPLGTEEIIADADAGYGSHNPDSDRRKFLRDRDALEQHGIFIAEVHCDGDHKAEERHWKLDRERTYATRGGISANDASVVLAAIDQTFALNAANPARWPLMRAYLKLAEAAGATAHVKTEQVSAAYNPTMQAIWCSLAARRPVRIAYVNSRGGHSERDLDVYGTLLRGSYTYLVGLDHASGEVRIFRCDRIVRAKRLPVSAGTYEIPATFDAKRHQFLPFDFSNDSPSEVVFTFPPQVDAYELDLLTLGRGELRRDETATTWTVEVRDMRAAASFALEHAARGMRPQAPIELVREWNDLITTAMAYPGKEQL